MLGAGRGAELDVSRAGTEHCSATAPSPRDQLCVEAPMPLTHFIFHCFPLQKGEEMKEGKKKKKKGGVE